MREITHVMSVQTPSGIAARFTATLEANACRHHRNQIQGPLKPPPHHACQNGTEEFYCVGTDLDPNYKKKRT